MAELTFSKKDAVQFNILTVKQPIGEFYIGVVEAKEAITICSAEERKLADRDSLEQYVGMQRPLDPNRVEEIKKYVKTWDAAFPNSIILAINPDCYFLEGNKIYIKRDKKSANIIDGQHRLAGFQEQEAKDFEVILTLFTELELEEQAYLFSVINTKMTKINPSLARDLYEFASINTPEKLVHNIAKTFNRESSNPWYDKIKMLGKREENSEAILSQSTFTDGILNLICDKKDSYEIRDILKRKKNKRDSLRNFYAKDKADKYILWKHFIEEEDKFVFIILKDFFLAVREIFNEAWEDRARILTKTTGYSALIQIFIELYKIGYVNGNLTRTFFSSYFIKAKKIIKSDALISENYPPGKVGETKLAADILEGMGLLG